VTARQLILSKINTLRSAANYDISDVPIEACAAPTTGSGCFGWVMVRAQRVVELFFFVVMRMRSDGGSANPLAQ
jgi:hypothetical protein